MAERLLVPRRTGGFADWLDLREQGATPKIIRPGRDFLYFKTDGKLYKYVNGVETEVGGAASGALTASGYTMATSRLIGRTAAGSGAPEELTLGAGLAFTAGQVYATGGSGTGLLAIAQYGPSSQANKATTNTSGLDDVDATNLAVTFTAPASGKVLIRLESAGYSNAGNGGWAQWGVKEGSTVIANNRQAFQSIGGTKHSVSYLKTGLTPGNSYTYKMAFGCGANGGTLTLYMSDGISTANGVGPAIIEIWEAP